jgi:hypothetical protein
MWSWLLFAGCRRGAPPAQPIPDDSCSLPAAEQLWMQEALDLWVWVTDRYLQRPDAALPWSVYFDRRCAYHVAGRPEVSAVSLGEVLAFRGEAVSVWGVAHSGWVWLPDGSQIPAEPHAAGALYDAPMPTPFFSMSLVEIWRTVPGATEVPDLSDQMLTIAQHEMTHTLQLQALGQALEALAAEGHNVLALDDDSIQRTFQADPSYAEAIAEEVSALHTAVLTPEPSDKRRLARRALELARHRQARYFVGPYALFARLDGVFLTMEGLGEWVRLALMRDAAELGERPALEEVDPDFAGYRIFRQMDLAAAIHALEGRERFWSQQEGLLVVLLLEQLLPGFPQRLLGPELPDALALLEEAAAEGRGR